MKISRLILLGLAGMFILTISGCATAPITTYRNYTLRITSNPSDAEIYINDKYVGRTPCYDAQIIVPYEFRDTYYEPHFVIRELKEQYMLRVSKKGYKDAIEQIDFKKKCSWDYTPAPLKTDYHFELEKK